MKIIRWLPLLVLAACGPAEIDATNPAPPEEEERGAANSEANLVTSLSALKGPLLRITMVDVGQGDGILVEFPNGKTLAVDGGPNKTDFADYLSGEGISRLDYMVLSHAHADHYQGLTPVLSLVPTDCNRRILNPGYDRSIESYQEFSGLAGCRYRQTGPGETIPADPSVSVRVLNASDRLQPSDQSHGVNNTSVVLRIKYKSFSILLQGDAEDESEQEMWQDLGQGLRSTVLKVGHHGSCTASARKFLQAVSPQYLLISVAQGNGFGLPHCQTMAKLNGLKARGARWSRTDRNGTITLTTDGTRYYVRRSFGQESEDACPRDCADPQEF